MQIIIHYSQTVAIGTPDPSFTDRFYWMAGFVICFICRLFRFYWFGFVDWCGLVWIGVDWCGLVWIGVDWFGLVWFPLIRHLGL